MQVKILWKIITEYPFILTDCTLFSQPYCKVLPEFVLVSQVNAYDLQILLLFLIKHSFKQTVLKILSILVLTDQYIQKTLKHTSPKIPGNRFYNCCPSKPRKAPNGLFFKLIKLLSVHDLLGQSRASSDVMHAVY